MPKKTPVQPDLNLAARPVSPGAAPEDGILEGLNPAQREAVLHDQGPLLIVAGAGTGKTNVLTKRIAHLIISKKAMPSEILALTFTDKAAHEMEERVDRLVPYGFNDVWVSTFHSFGDRILREHAFEIGLSPDLRVMTQAEAVVFFRQNLFAFKLNHYRPLTDPTKFIRSLLTTFSRAKDEEVLPEAYLEYANDLTEKAANAEEKEAAEKHLEAAEAYKTYEDLKTRGGFIDFGDQVLLCLKIFREHPAVLKKIQTRFKYLLVDEFQDTNFAQFELLKLIAGAHKNITVVGDDDQSIYKFRGACLSNILNFREAYPGAKQIVLQDNYRSTQEILDAAYKLIKHNNPDRLEAKDNLNKYLRASKGSGKAVRYYNFDTLFSESEFVSQEIKRRIESEGREPRDFAVLVRTNAGAEPFMKSLNLLGVPWQFSGNAGLYEQEEVRLALSFLRILDRPDDNASLYYLAISPIYELHEDDLARLNYVASKTNHPLLKVFKDHASLEPALGLSEAGKAKAAKISDDLARYRKLAANLPSGNLLYRFFEDSGTLKKLAESTDYKSVQQAQNLQRFFEIIKKFGQVCKYDRAHFFIEYVESLRLAGDDPSSAEASLDENAVNLLTVHAAKGLEFPVIYLVGLEQGHFPATDRGDPIELPDELIREQLPQGNMHIQEERRLFYVGLTRAKDELVLCTAKDHGKKKVWKPSQYILEALDKPEVSEVSIKAKPLESLKIFSGDGAAAVPLEVPPQEPAGERPPVNFQATAVEDYLTCPLKYKYAKVVRIPVPMHHTAVFGVAVHKALETFHLARRGGNAVSVDALLEVFKNAWKSEGFVSREHEDIRFQEGVRLLKSYYETESKSGVLPALVEESFKLSLGEARISGRWDRVDITDRESVIIDYKTGDVKDQKDADKKAKESVQLGLYALAFESRFGRLPDRMVLNFIKHGVTGTALPTPKKIEDVTDKAQKVVAGIAGKKFDPTPGYQCRWCPFEKICPAADK